MLKKLEKSLNKMKIQKRLLVCFLIVVIMASISGILGTILLIRTDSNYSSALVENGFSQGDIGKFNTYLNKSSALVRDVIFLTDSEEVKSAQQEVEQLEQKTKDALEALKVNCTTGKELELIKVIDEKLPLYEEKRDQVIELGVANQDEEALKVFREEARPLLNECMTAAEDLMDLNVSMGDQVSSSLSTQSRVTIAIIVVVIVVVFLISIGFAKFVARAFAEPIIRVKDASAKLAKGELDIEITEESADEIGEMTCSFREATEMLRLYVSEIGRGLGEISRGNFDISSDVDFKGEFVALEDAINKITKELSHTLYQINEASEQVAAGSGQMAENAQALAEGATDQAGAVEELTATVENVTALAENSAENANSSYESARGYETEAENSTVKMKELTQAMGRISDTSKEIEDIITEIEDIASQTNLLSLNASIEAARAGEAGKGFAVVADQIGKLASDSAESAVHTRQLISKSLEEIERGNAITSATSEALEKVIEGIKNLAGASREISDMSKGQADAMKQIEVGIEQISSVVQTNSASAEETSAASEELSAQSQNLKVLVEQFQLNEKIIRELEK